MNSHCSTLARSPRNALLFLLIVGLFTTVNSLSSQPRTIVAVKHFNSDGVADTLIGTRSSGRYFLPHSIKWGNTGFLVVHQTLFSYPAWVGLEGSTAIGEFNSDTLSDIILFFKGSTGSTLHDTSRVVIIGGGASLNLQPVVTIATLPSSQSSPFYSQDLSDGTGFTDGAIVDPTGQKSWRFSVSFPAQPLVTHVPEPPGWTVRLYPNPTSGAGTQMEGHNVPAGRYSVSIHSLQGTTLAEQTIDVDGSGEFLRILDLHSLASGTYTVRLAGVNTPGVFTYSLVIIR